MGTDQWPPRSVYILYSLVHELKVELCGYKGELRQIIVRSSEKPAFLITNDFDAPVELLLGNYARRRRVENGIAEAGGITFSI